MSNIVTTKTLYANRKIEKGPFDTIDVTELEPQQVTPDELVPPAELEALYNPPPPPPVAPPVTKPKGKGKLKSGTGILEAHEILEELAGHFQINSLIHNLILDAIDALEGHARSRTKKP